MFLIGPDPGSVYSEDDIAKGKAPAKGTRSEVVSGSGTKEFIMCQVKTGNVTQGMICEIQPDFRIIITSIGAPAPLDQARLGIAMATVTASTSQYIWCQVAGVCNVLASASCSSSVALGLGITVGGGYVDDGLSTLSAFVQGIWLTATSGPGGLTAAILDYPRYQPKG